MSISANQTHDTGKCACSKCGHGFKTLSAFDKHRTGPYGWGSRRCLSAEEMTAKGFRLHATGRWMAPPSRHDLERGPLLFRRRASGPVVHAASAPP